MRNFVLVSILLLVTLAGFGQKFSNENSKWYGSTLKQILKAANTYYEVDKDYYGAMEGYEAAFEAKPDRWDVRYRYAESARQVGAYTRALEGYLDVVENNEKKDFPLAVFWLGYMYQVLGKYTEAIAAYDKFLGEEIGNESVSTEYIDRAKLERKSSEWSRDIAQVQNNISVQHLEGSINTPNKEFGAFVLNDTLFYSSINFESRNDKGTAARSYARVMFTVDKENGEQLVGQVNDTLRHTANLVWNQTRDKRYFTRCDYLGKYSAEIDCDIFVQEKNPDGSWNEPKLLPDHINVKGYNQTHPSYGIDKTTGRTYLYFVSNQEGGKGKLDIWRSEILGDDSYAMPENVHEVNTAQNEITPFFHNPTNTLYFSSEGFQGLGGFDVYKTKKLPNGWEEITNVGKPVNSSLNDSYFTLNENGSTGYFSSNRVGANYLDENYELCCDDLYAAEFDIMIETRVYTFNSTDNESLEDTELYLAEILPDGSLEELAYNLQAIGNEHLLYLDKGKSYYLRASKDGFEEKVDTLRIDVDEEKTEIIHSMYLDPIEVNLEVFVQDADMGTPLFDALVSIIEIKDNGDEVVISQQSNEYGNDFYFLLEKDKNYIIRAEKSGFQPLEGLEIDTHGLTKSETFRAELSLKRASFDDLLPLTVYFDNDLPGRRSKSKTTDISYEETVETYYGKKEEFKLLFTDPLDQEDAFLTAERYELFFEREVRQGLKDLKKLAEGLVDFLSRGNEITIRMKGFASPRADEYYNYNLSKRRIVSVENYFRSYNGGILMDYINRGVLIIDSDPIGEKNAPNYVISRIEDERNSIYSLGASVERRVELEAVEVRLNDAEEQSSKAFTSKGLDR